MPSPPWCLHLSQVGWPWSGEDGEVSTNGYTLSRSEVPLPAPGHGGRDAPLGELISFRSRHLLQLEKLHHENATHEAAGTCSSVTSRCWQRRLINSVRPNHRIVEVGSHL